MKRVCYHKHFFAITMLVIISLACSSQITVFDPSSPPSVETLVESTLAVMTADAPTASATIVPTSIPTTASPTQGTFGEVYVNTIVENVNLRTNPGTLFTVSRVMPQDTRLLLLGQSPGGEWLNVMNDEGIAGWVNMNVVLMSHDGPPPPVIEPSGVQLVTGTVETVLGTPVSGIGFAISQGTRNTSATTDGAGRFYAYLPPNMSGTWIVEQLAVSCTSNTMDADCNCISNYCGSGHPSSMTVLLPQSEPLDFLWK